MFFLSRFFVLFMFLLTPISAFAGSAESLIKAIKAKDLVRMDQVMMDRRIDISTIDVESVAKDNIFTLAARIGNLDIVRKIAEYANSNGDAFYKKEQHATPLYIASQEGHLEVVEYLISKNAYVNNAKSDGATPLYAAAYYGREKIVEALLTARANVDQQRNDGCTPLYAASRNGFVNIVEKLIKANASVDEAANDNTTPLHLASQNGNIKIIQKLLLAGANPDQERLDGSTPISLAAEKGHLEAVELLAKARLDILNYLRVHTSTETAPPPTTTDAMGGAGAEASSEAVSQPILVSPEALRKTHTATILPVLCALQKACSFYPGQDYRSARAIVMPDNYLQNIFVQNWGNTIRAPLELDKKECDGIASYSVREINDFLDAADIKSDLLPDSEGEAGGLHIASFFKSKLKWVIPAHKRSILYGDKYYAAAKLDQKDLYNPSEKMNIMTSYKRDGFPSILKIQTENGDNVFMSMLARHELPLETPLDLLLRIKNQDPRFSVTGSVETSIEMAFFPLIKILEKIDLSFIEGLTITGGTESIKIAKARQITDFLINLEGVSVESLSKMDVASSSSSETKREFVIDDDFYFWILRPGQIEPHFAAFIAKDSWVLFKDFYKYCSPASLLDYPGHHGWTGKEDPSSLAYRVFNNEKGTKKLIKGIKSRDLFKAQAATRDLFKIIPGTLVPGSEQQDNIFTLAARCGNLEIFKMIVEVIEKYEGENMNLFFIAGDPGITALYVASEMGHTEIVKFLIEKGAKVSKKTIGGSSPFEIATLNGHTETAELIARHIRK